MKIGYLISNYLPKVGGAEIFTHNLVKRVSANGHEAVVITPSRGGANDRIYEYGILRLNPLLIKLLFADFRLGRLYLERLLYRLQKKYEFDIWHVIIGYPLGAAAIDFFNKNNIPCVLRPSGEDIQILPELSYGYRLNKRVDAIVRENYKKFTAVIAPGNDTRRDYISLAVPENRVAIIPTGVDCAKFQLDADREKIRRELGVGDEKLIITVGRNHPKKGYRYIPLIMKELLKNGARFKWLLVGRDCEEIKRIADKDGVGEHLIIRNVKTAVSDKVEPEVPNNELIRYYKASDIFVFPTLIELFAKVLIEAMAAGLPIVTTDTPGVSDIIQNNENGLICKRGDIGCLAGSILKLFSDGGAVRRLSENALRDAKNYDWDKITAKYLALYKSKTGQVCEKAFLQAQTCPDLQCPPAVRVKKIGDGSAGKAKPVPRTNLNLSPQVRVAHIITDLDIGGAEMMLLKTLRNFESDRYEHFVISLKPIGRIGEMIRDEGFRVYSLNLNIYNFVSALMRLFSILRKEKPQITHNYLFHADILGRIVAKVVGIPIVISSLRSVEIGGRLREKLLSMTDFCVDRVTAVSQAAANAHISKGTTRREKILPIYNGVELHAGRSVDSSSARRKFGAEDGTFVLLSVGRLEPVKGYTFLLDALKSLRGKGYKFRLVAVGRGEERLRKDIAARRLENEIILTGEKEDISELLAISDAFVLSSLWEGMPNALLEAMAAGLPVVATRVGGVPEVITDNETGLLVEPKDTRTLEEAIERILKEPGLRERLARNAKDYVRKNFDIKRTASKTEELYEELLKAHGKD